MPVRTAPLAALLALAAAPALATSLSMNAAPLPAGTTVEACKAAGTKALAGAGLAALPAAPVSVFATGEAGLLASIYCLPQNGIAIIAVAAESHDATRATLGRLEQLFHPG